jgi:hypothetical protein
VPDVTTSTQIGLTWDDGADDGGSAILDYKIDKAIENGEFELLETELTSKEYVAVSLTPGVTYRFQAYARNANGYSAPSAEVQILAA